MSLCLPRLITNVCCGFKKALVSYSNGVEIFSKLPIEAAKGNPYSQLTELTTKEMLITMFPNISTHANICLSIPVGTASVDVLRYFKCGSTMRNVSLDNLESSNGTLYAKSIPPEDGFYM